MVEVVVVQLASCSGSHAVTACVVVVVPHGSVSLKHQPKPPDASPSHVQPSASLHDVSSDSDPHTTSASRSWHRNDSAMYSQRSLGHDSALKKRRQGTSTPCSWHRKMSLNHVQRSSGQSPSLKNTLQGASSPSTRQVKRWLS